MGVLGTEKEQERDIDLFLVFERILLSVNFKAAKILTSQQAYILSSPQQIQVIVLKYNIHYLLKLKKKKRVLSGARWEVLERWFDSKKEKWKWKRLLFSYIV